MFFPAPTEILILLLQRQHLSELAGFAACFRVREEFFCPAFIRLNLVTAMNQFLKQCSLVDVHSCTASHNRDYISLI